MAVRIARIVGVFAAIGLLYALTRDSLPGWMYITLLAGAIWVAFRLWDADSGGRGGRGR